MGVRPGSRLADKPPAISLFVIVKRLNEVCIDRVCVFSGAIREGANAKSNVKCDVKRPHIPASRGKGCVVCQDLVVGVTPASEV